EWPRRAGLLRGARRLGPAHRRMGSADEVDAGAGAWERPRRVVGDDAAGLPPRRLRARGHAVGAGAPGLIVPDLSQAWPRPAHPRPIVIIGAGAIVRTAHLPAYR